jgi:hypothetical protein
MAGILVTAWNATRGFLGLVQVRPLLNNYDTESTSAGQDEHVSFSFLCLVERLHENETSLY